MAGFLFAVSLPLAVSAQSLSVGPAPYSDPLFLQVYRQSLYAAARHQYGLDAYDAQISASPPDAYRVVFSSAPRQLIIRLVLGPKTLAQEAAPFPVKHWDIVAEADKASAAAELLLRKVFPMPQGRPAVTDKDLEHARAGYPWLDVFSVAWTVNELSAAQQGKEPSAEVLRRLSASYAWLGDWMSRLPGSKSKIFFARALAYAALARRLGLQADSEEALALALCGRDADALFVVHRSSPDDAADSALAQALAVRDSAAVHARLEDPDPRWRAAAAHVDLENGAARDALVALRRSAVEDPLDFAALSQIVENEDVQNDRSLSRFYFTAVSGWDPALDLVRGRLVPDAERRQMQGDPPAMEAYLKVLREIPAADHNEEIPAPARVDMLGLYAMDAAFARVDFLARRYGSEPEAAEFLRAIDPLLRAHPWGVAVLSSQGETDPQTRVAFARFLATTPMTLGAYRLLSAYASSVALSTAAVRAEAEFDDVAPEWTPRLWSADPKERSAAAARLTALAPSDYKAYEALARSDPSRRLWDQALTRFPSAPGLLRDAASYEAEQEPRDEVRYESLLDRLIANDPDDADARVQKHYLLLARGDETGAVATLQDYLKQGSDNQAAAKFLDLTARVYLMKGKLDLAEALALSAFQSDKAGALYRLAYVYEQRHRYALAEEVIRAGIQRYGNGDRTPLILFLLRTGDPRGTALLRADIDGFSARQQTPGVIIGELDYRRLLDEYILARHWEEAEKLLNEILLPRWHGDDPEYGLWLAVCGQRIGRSNKNVLDLLRRQLAKAPPGAKLRPLLELYLGERGVASTLRELDVDAEVRSQADFFIAEYLRGGSHPEQAHEYYERCRRELVYNTKEYYLALLELNAVPGYATRLARGWAAQWRDMLHVADNWKTVRADGGLHAP